MELCNVALNKSVYAGGMDASAVTNGKNENFIIGELYPKHIDIDLDGLYDIEEIAIIGADFADFTYNVYTSADGVGFDRYGKCATNTDDLKAIIKNKASARVVRVLVTGNSQGAKGKAAIAQVEVYGSLIKGDLSPIRKKLEISDYDTWLLNKHGIDLSKIKNENGRYNIKDTYTAKDTVDALNGLVSRLLGNEYIDWFEFEIDRDCVDKNYYELSDFEGKIKIKADCGVSAATGLNYYLKYFCKVQISQQLEQVNMPEKVVAVGKVIYQSSPYKVRYAYNYCTLSYTTPFYGYEAWQRELDFLMLSGVNLILDTTGTEALWVSYLQKLGYTTDEAKDYVSGPCYKAFWLMGNLEGYGGPVADSWVIDTLELARTNQRYMTVMGAQPALQTFVGAMPESFGRIANTHLLEKGFEDVVPYMAYQGLWADGFVRPNILKTTYPAYSYLAKLFYDTQNEIYGCVTNYYCGDVCHEGGIVPEDLSKPEMSKKLLDELLKADENAVWILQAWWSNPMKEVLQGFGENKVEHIMILDLAALANPRWPDEKTWDGKEFGGTPWIFCILDNYGGRAGMHGKLREMASLIDSACKEAKFMAGIGITPEGTNANPVVYELFWEMAWRNEAPDIDQWIDKYPERRYGKATENTKAAWRIFEKTIYGIETIDGATKLNVIQENPSLAMGYCRKRYHKIGFDRNEFEQGFKLFMEDYDILRNNEHYIYDVVDLMRMSLCIATDDYFEVLRRAFALKRADLFKEYSEKFLECIYLIGEVSTYNKDELMGNWVYRSHDWMSDTRNGKYSDFDRDMMEYNTRIIIADWASSPIQNYANRQYDGLMQDYFYQTWKEHLYKVNEAFEKGEDAPEKMPWERGFELGWIFSMNDKHYRRNAAKPEGDDTDRGLKAIWSDILKHMNKAETMKPVLEMEKVLEGMNLTIKDELTAAIATNIEH